MGLLTDKVATVTGDATATGADTMKDQDPSGEDMPVTTTAGSAPDDAFEVVDALDEALEESFPASDPPSSSNFD